MKMKIFSLGIITFIIGFFILWVTHVFPYPSCSNKQIEITKQELIDGILAREIKLRELYAEAHNRKFVQTNTFKKQLKYEKDKFYKYCDDSLSHPLNNDYCNISKTRTLWNFSLYTEISVIYKFDNDSKDFFNQIPTYWRYKRDSTNPTGRKKIWRDIFWKPQVEDKYLYEVELQGYKSLYGFFSCSDSPDSHLLGEEIVKLGNETPVKKADLTFVDSFTYTAGTTRDSGIMVGRDIPIGIKVYIKKEK